MQQGRSSQVGISIALIIIECMRLRRKVYTMVHAICAERLGIAQIVSAKRRPQEDLLAISERRAWHAPCVLGRLFPSAPRGAVMNPRMRPYSRRLLLAVAAASSFAFALPANAEETVKVGVVAAMSGQSAKSGEAIVRGLSLAIDEINAGGGYSARRSNCWYATTRAIPPRAGLHRANWGSAKRSGRSSAGAAHRTRTRTSRFPTVP